MKKLLSVVLLELKKLFSGVDEVDHSLGQSGDGEMVVFAHFGFPCRGVATTFLVRDEDTCLAARLRYMSSVD